MKNPFTQEEKALLASVLPKLADKLVPDKNPQVRNHLMGQMAAAYVQSYQAPVGKKEIANALVLCDENATAESIVLTAQIYANARPDLRVAMGKAIAAGKMAGRKKIASHSNGNAASNRRQREQKTR